MNPGKQAHLVWPLILAAAFLFIPVILFSIFPIGFWNSTDNEPLGLANAVNMAYRLADLRLYPAEGMTNHPGVQFYLMSWLALALTGHPVASSGQEWFFRTVIDHVEEYHRAIVFVAALVGAAGVYVLAKTALKLSSVGVTAVALLIWLVSTPATILGFMSSGFESVAILINGLFLVVLVRLAFDREIDPKVIVLAGLVGAFAYLNKLSYVYVPLALVSAIFWKAVFCGVGRRRGAALIALSFFTFVGTIVATGYLFIGWDAFISLLRFHRNVILGSGLYGAGTQIVVSPEGVWHAVMAIPAERDYAIPLAVIAGGTLYIAGLVAGFKNRKDNGVAVMAIGAGLAALFSALIVLKHYASHYSAGVSATLPACVVVFSLFAQAWSYRARFSAVAIAWAAALVMASPVLLSVRNVLASNSDSTRRASADMQELKAWIAGVGKPVTFAYRVPFPQYGEGFVVRYAHVPRLTEEYLRSRGGVSNSLTEELITEDIGAYVIDKNYFPDAEAVKSAPNLDLLGPRPVRLGVDDKLIELRTVFLLIRK